MKAEFFNSNLQLASMRLTPAKGSTRYFLDKNEQSGDVDPKLKKRILDSLMKENWNRYPGADHRDIEEKIASYCGLHSENIVLSAGSASIITTLLDYFALNQKSIVITQPSYSLFDYHCKTYNISYEPWLLNEKLEFSLDTLPILSANSVLIITSPNNPVGNAIQRHELEYILRKHPDSLIVLDAVYSEFADEDFTSLVNDFPNLVVLRSFSKAFPIAGLRLGYLCASSQVAAIIRKLVLQFSINYFSLIFAREMLFDQDFMKEARAQVRDIKKRRDAAFEFINLQFDEDLIKAYRSQGNFLLLRFMNSEVFEKLMSCFESKGIKVLNCSNFPLLKNSFRVSIGNPTETRAFMDCLNRNLDRKSSLYKDQEAPFAISE